MIEFVETMLRGQPCDRRVVPAARSPFRGDASLQGFEVLAGFEVVREQSATSTARAESPHERARLLLRICDVCSTSAVHSQPSFGEGCHEIEVLGVALACVFGGRRIRERLDLASPVDLGSRQGSLDQQRRRAIGLRTAEFVASLHESRLDETACLETVNRWEVLAVPRRDCSSDLLPRERGLAGGIGCKESPRHLLLGRRQPVLPSASIEGKLDPQQATFVANRLHFGGAFVGLFEEVVDSFYVDPESLTNPLAHLAKRPLTLATGGSDPNRHVPTGHGVHFEKQSSPFESGVDEPLVDLVDRLLVHNLCNRFLWHLFLHTVVLEHAPRFFGSWFGGYEQPVPLTARVCDV